MAEVVVICAMVNAWSTRLVMPAQPAPGECRRKYKYNLRYAWAGFRRLCARFVGAYPTCHLAVRLKALLRNTPKDQVSSEWMMLKANWKATKHSVVADAAAVSDCHSAVCVRWVDG